MQNVSFLIDKEHSWRPLRPLVEALVECLCDPDLQGAPQDDALRALARTRELVGESRFAAYVDQIPEPLRGKYRRLVAPSGGGGEEGRALEAGGKERSPDKMNVENRSSTDKNERIGFSEKPPRDANPEKQDLLSNKVSSDGATSKPSRPDWVTSGPNAAHDWPNEPRDFPVTRPARVPAGQSRSADAIRQTPFGYDVTGAGGQESGLVYGLVPGHLMMRLDARANVRTRTEAVEELRRVVGGVREMSGGKHDVASFIALLSGLLDDAATLQVGRSLTL